jgi:hypothetical protein
MYFLYAMPFADKARNIHEVVNETTTLVVSYHIICFTDFVMKPEAKFQMGYSIMVTIGINISFGLIVLIADMIMSFRR